MRLVRQMEGMKTDHGVSYAEQCRTNSIGYSSLMRWKARMNEGRELVEAPSPSGFEQPAQRVLRKHLEPVADEMRTDVMGNLIARLDGKGGPKLMLAGHCDEIGFMVQYIDDSGFIYFGAIGGVDPHLTPGQRISIIR